MSLTIHVPKPDTPLRRVQASEAPGRPWNRLAGGWIDDQVELKKFVMLCPFCVHKFNPRKNHYEVWRREVQGIGKCDDCKQISPYLKGFIHQSSHDLGGDFMVGGPKRRRGRWARG